ELWRRREAGELAVVEIVPGARTVLLDGLDDPSGAQAAIRTWTQSYDIPEPAAAPAEPASVTVPVEFDGEDLGDVARLWRTDEQGVVDGLLPTELRVAFSGSAPGWASLSGLPDELAVPRLDNPRARVPAGSVALGDTYAGIYPTASP